MAQLRQLMQADLAAFLQVRPHKCGSEMLLDNAALTELAFCLGFPQELGSQRSRPMQSLTYVSGIRQGMQQCSHKKAKFYAALED